METSGKRVFEELCTAIRQSVSELAMNYSTNSFSNIFIVVDKLDGVLTVYNNEKNNIHQTTISDWSETDTELDDSEVASILGDVVEYLDREEDLFSTLDIEGSFSISYVTEEFELIDELLTITEDAIVDVDDMFLNKMDKDFDDFLERLMKE